MSERPLPEDLGSWPDDANELLGVSFGMSPRELRRAYNRLIRIYKPEQFPEQFRRIREAYEYLLRFADLFGSNVEASDPPPDEEPQLLPAPKESSSATPVSEWVPQAPRPEDELDELWVSAVTRQPSPAYQRLLQFHQQSTGRVEIYLRLYWLLTLFPELDSRHVPADWLVQGLLATGLAGPLRELYREEVADNPAEALSERYGRLLDAPLDAGQLADLAERRFQAAGRLQRWDVITAELPRLRLRFGLDEEQLWLRLLFGLADVLAWAEDAEALALFESIRAEIVHHEHLASQLPYAFDRFDLLLGASAGWYDLRRLGRVPATMLRLIGDSWSHPFAEVRESLMRILESIASSPQRWLDHLDEMHQRAPATLALFGELLDRFEEIRETVPTESRDRQILIELVLPFLPSVDAANYFAERSRLLAFCLREAVALEEMAEVASIFADGWEEVSAAWVKVLTDDWPLRYVCRACRLFWA